MSKLLLCTLLAFQTLSPEGEWAFKDTPELTGRPAGRKRVTKMTGPCQYTTWVYEKDGTPYSRTSGRQYGKPTIPDWFSPQAQVDRARIDQVRGKITQKQVDLLIIKLIRRRAGDN